MANHMAEVAKMLGVELDEEFETPVYSSEKYKININGIAVYEDGEWKYSLASTSFVFEKLLAGQYEIKRKPWKPKDGDIFYFIGSDGDIYHYYAECGLTYHNNFYKIGNCYRTREEAEANRDKWIAFYVSDEVLEV